MQRIMSDSALFSLLYSRPPSPNSAVQSAVRSPSIPSSSPDSPAGSSRILPYSQIVNESANHRLGYIPNPQGIFAMFQNIGQVYIRGGIFSQYIYNANNRDNVLKSLPLSRDAVFSAAIDLDNLTRRSCTNGTRVDIIAQIMTWVNETNPTRAPPVYWLTGLAGLGKTTIAYTICERLTDARLPFTSFFCSLQLDSRKSNLLVTTLCHDLAELYKPYADSVLSILETNSKVVNAGLRIQIDELLVKPWQASIAQRNSRNVPTPIVVVDALDENNRGIEFLEELLRVIHAGHLAGIKFLITSRPHPKIVDICKSFPPSAVCKLHEINAADVQNDIEKYLREALPALEDEPKLALLSQRAGGLFIYATTAVRFISPPYSSVSEMRSSLETMLNTGLLTSYDYGERSLVDELYGRILGDAFRDASVRATRLRILHTIICAETSVDVTVLAALADTKQDTVESVVESLHAVLFVSPKDNCVYWYHSSFYDFVCSQVRAKICISFPQSHPTFHIVDIFCEPAAYHGILARRCFSIMREKLHFNMCKLPSSYIFDSEVPGLNALVHSTFRPTLRYVSRHWARHLSQAMSANNNTGVLIRELKDFLCNTLLFWIEAMNLIGAISECSSLQKEVDLWVERVMDWPTLVAEIIDATKFLAFFAGSPASKSTPHLYISALSMWDQDSATCRNWRERFLFIPSISRTVTIPIPVMTIRMTEAVRCIALSPDGNRIVSASDEASVWDAKTGKRLIELQGHTLMVMSVGFSPDGNSIVSSSGDNSVRMWNSKTGKQLKELQGHTDWVWSVRFSPDGQQIVSGSADNSVRVWDVKTGNHLREMQGHTSRVLSVEFSPDGKTIVSGSGDNSVRMWNSKTGDQLRELQGHTYCVWSVGFSPDGNSVVSGSRDKSVRVWDAKTGEQLRLLAGHTDLVRSVGFSPDGKSIVSGSVDKSVRVWDSKTGEQLRELQGHTDSVWSVRFSPDGQHIVSGSHDKSVQVWDLKTGEQLREVQGHSKLGKQLRMVQGHTDCVFSVGFSPDGNSIVSGSADKSLRVWDAKTGKQLRELQGHTHTVWSVGFSPDGNSIVSGSRDKSMRVWDSKTGRQLWVLEGCINWVWSVEFSPDGNSIVSGSDDKSVRVWDSKTGKLLRVLEGYKNLVQSVRFSPDGNSVVSSLGDSSVQVWDSKTGKKLKELQGHTKWVRSVGFSPDGQQIVSGSGDNSVRVWDVKTGKLLRELQGHTNCVFSVGFSPDGNSIVSGSGDKSLRVWDAKTGKQLRELRGHTETVGSVGFSPDGQQIVSGSDDNSVRVWHNLDLDAPWAVEEDGWIISDAKRLVWVPSTICNVLLHPHNKFIISQNGFAAISFEQCKLGTLWHKCYTP